MTSRYTVDILDRIEALMLGSVVREDDDVTYTFYKGYESLDVKHSGGGSYHYQGAYHPDSICETDSGADKGICKWCGRTLM
jgi:hypothetical protein